ncbi:MAG: hypothetical protein ACRDAQ_08885 [Cetobacterium sp.]
MNIKVAFTNFFQKRTAFPRYKSKKIARKSYTTNSVNNSIRIEGNSIKLHRAIPQNYIIKSATISREPNGAFYVSILTEFQRADYPRFFRKLETNR